MITLYTKAGCPFSAQVLVELARLNLEFKRKDISKDEAALAELLEIGGRKQSPFLIDSEHDFAQYESKDIVAFLKRTYDAGSVATSDAPARPRVHISDAHCVACEG